MTKYLDKLDKCHEPIYEDMDITIPYTHLLLDKIELGDRPIKVVYDCGNGTTSIIADQIFANLNVEAIPLFNISDGTFPNHHPDPCVYDNLTKLKETSYSSKDYFFIFTRLFELGLIYYNETQFNNFYYEHLFDSYRKLLNFGKFDELESYYKELERNRNIILEVLEKRFNEIKGGKGISIVVSLTSVIGVNLYQFMIDNRKRG